MDHEYTNKYFEYIEEGSVPSARAVSGALMPLLRPTSLLDVGCGRGAWLEQWHKAGVTDYFGVDGPYVDTAELRIPAERFARHDLSRPLDLGRRFDLVQSLEVAEHLPRAAAQTFVENLVRHGDTILFSAAVVGQGGEHHVNERPLEYWRALFRAEGYAAYDLVRPLIAGRNDVEPWYRFNTILYCTESASERLPRVAAATQIAEEDRIHEGGDLSWALRRALVRLMPRPMVNWIAKAKAGRTLP